jgi:hypothetical protein
LGQLPPDCFLKPHQDIKDKPNFQFYNEVVNLYLMLMFFMLSHVTYSSFSNFSCLILKETRLIQRNVIPYLLFVLAKC